MENTEVQDINEQQEQDKYAATALVLKEKVAALVVCDKETALLAQSIEETAKDNVKMLTEHMEPVISEAHARHKKLTETRKRLTEPFEAVAKEARQKRLAWDAEEVKGAREVWSCIITDQKKLFKALPTSPFMPDLTEDELEKLCTVLKLKKHAASLKNNFKLAGVKVISKVV